MSFSYLTSFLLGLFLFPAAVGMFHYIFPFLSFLRVTKMYYENIHLSSWLRKRFEVDIPSLYSLFHKSYVYAALVRISHIFSSVQ